MSEAEKESETDAADTVEASPDSEETASKLFGPLPPVNIKATTTVVVQIDSA
jgi:hypothetical protein